jgi:hypothetical protein
MVRTIGTVANAAERDWQESASVCLSNPSQSGSPRLRSVNVQLYDRT